MTQGSVFKKYTRILLVTVCLLVALIPAVLAATGSTDLSGGTIVVTSYPDGAAVSLNGEYRGQTPVTLSSVSPGDYTVTVFLAGYLKEEIPLILWDGSRRDILVQLKQDSSAPQGISSGGDGSIAIDSIPGGAFVTLDGVAAGQTPAVHASLILNSVPAGEHTILVELAGYLPYTATVHVVKNQVSQVNAELSGTGPSATSAVPTAMAQRAPTQQSGVSPAIFLGSCGLIGIIAVLRRF